MSALGAGRVVADNGTVAYIDSGLTLLTPTTVTRVPLASPYSGAAVIDSAARNVVYLSDGSLRLYRIAAQQHAVLAPANSYAPYLAADGSRVMFLSGTPPALQIYTVNTDGSALRQVTRESSGVTLAAMSDDGRVAWYFSGDARLYQLNLDTGEARPRMAAPPRIGDPFPIAPGSTYVLSGTGFSDSLFTADFPLPRTLGDVSVTVNGIPAPLYSVAPSQIVFQVPWATSGNATVEVHAASTSPFEPRLGFQAVTSPVLPALLLAIHEDWQAVVSPAQPARPGEVLHLYGTGLGPVDQPQPDGVPAPANPPARTLAPVTCTGVPVLFAGLAPGLAGYYQMEIRSGSFPLTCQIQSSTFQLP
jgi:uncharacterized protein (TIGR03437 family)